MKKHCLFSFVLSTESCLYLRSQLKVRLFNLHTKMAKVTLKGNEIHTNGELPKVGTEAPDFKGVKSDLSELSLSDLKGKKVVINVFPSLDTSVCAASVRRFNKEAASHPDTVVLAVSKDLPFAHGRFCTTEGIDKVITLSVFRCSCFEDKYGTVSYTHLTLPTNSLV